MSKTLMFTYLSFCIYIIIVIIDNLKSSSSIIYKIQLNSFIDLYVKLYYI